MIRHNTPWEFERAVLNNRESQQPFAVATIISVQGSTSAKPGDKALISSVGKTMNGWIGGGCAESYVCKQAIEAIEQDRCRIVEVDLDDEILGLGLPCGGKMSVFIEPHLPPTILRFPSQGRVDPVLDRIASHMGIKLQFQSNPSRVEGQDFEAETGQTNSPPISEVLPLSLWQLARTLAESRGQRFCPLSRLATTREAKISAESQAPDFFSGHPTYPSEIWLLGAGRITESLARLTVLLGWRTRILGSNINSADYPTAAECLEMTPDFKNFRISPGSYCLIATHQTSDVQCVAHALENGAHYVGLVASQKRSKIIYDSLRTQNLEPQAVERLKAPAGLQIFCKNPAEVALSVLCEMLEVAYDFDRPYVERV